MSQRALTAAINLKYPPEEGEKPLHETTISNIFKLKYPSSAEIPRIADVLDLPFRTDPQLKAWNDVGVRLLEVVGEDGMADYVDRVIRALEIEQEKSELLPATPDDDE